MEHSANFEQPSGIAHDFGNMLQLATSALRVTRRRLVAAGHVEPTATIDDALDALGRANLLAHRLMTSSPSPRTAKPVFLHDVCASVHKMLRHSLADDIRLETVIPDGLPPVTCDAYQLENALINLAINARDAMPDGGDLTIRGERCGDDGHGPLCITVSVTDTGCGMSPEICEQAFTPFFTTKKLTGNGIGLGAVRRFAEDLGGSAHIHSVPAHGTSVRLHLPGSTTRSAA